MQDGRRHGKHSERQREVGSAEDEETTHCISKGHNFQRSGISARDLDEIGDVTMSLVSSQ